MRGTVRSVDESRGAELDGSAGLDTFSWPGFFVVVVVEGARSVIVSVVFVVMFIFLSVGILFALSRTIQSSPASTEINC